jgi:hypothetical protein
MARIDYPAINKALAEQFGDGEVELRKAAKDDPFTYLLWFKQDDTPKATINAAKKIVARFVPSHWHDELLRHVNA